MTSIIHPTYSGGSDITSYSLEWDQGTNGASYESIIGETSNNIQLSQTKTGLTKGTIYYFRYRAKNIYDWSPYSNIIQQIAARVPDSPAAPITSNVATSVLITWATPYDGGSSVTTYNVQILTKSGLYLEEETYCNARTDDTVINNGYCAIPMSILTASPYLLIQGDEVVAQVLAANMLGDSAYSALSSSQTTKAYVQIKPHKPALGPSRGDNTSTDQIEVDIAALTDTNTGGSAITSYQIDYDYNTNGSEW